MKRTTKGVLIASGIAIVGAGAIAGTAIAERGEGYKRGSHHGSEGRRGGMRGMFGREMTKEDFEAKARARFAAADVNSDGVIDGDEIEARIKTRMEKRRGHRGRRGGRGGDRLARLDGDGDGKVTLDEMKKRVEERFARVDLNNDGQITDDDLPPRMRGRDVLKGEGGMRGRGHGRRGGHMMRKIGRFVKADANNDGVITKDEVLAQAEARFKRRDANGDGVIDQADRDAHQAAAIDYRKKRYIHRFGAEADAAGKVTREQYMGKASEMFARLDADKDGKLQRNEMRGMRHMMGGRDGGRRGRGWHRGGRGGHGHDGRRGSHRG